MPEQMLNCSLLVYLQVEASCRELKQELNQHQFEAARQQQEHQQLSEALQQAHADAQETQAALDALQTSSHALFTHVSHLAQHVLTQLQQTRPSSDATMSSTSQPSAALSKVAQDADSTATVLECLHEQTQELALAQGGASLEAAWKLLDASKAALLAHSAHLHALCTTYQQQLDAAQPNIQVTLECTAGALRAATELLPADTPAARAVATAVAALEQRDGVEYGTSSSSAALSSKASEQARVLMQAVEGLCSRVRELQQQSAEAREEMVRVRNSAAQEWGSLKEEVERAMQVCIVDR